MKLSANEMHSTRKMVIMAMLVAISVIFTAFIRIPGIFPAASFLEYHAGDIPILIGSFMFGPLTGVLLSFTQTALQSLLLASSDGFVGWLMNFLAGGTLAFIIGFVFKKGKQTYLTSVAAMVIGALCMTITMVGWNLIVTPWYYGMPTNAVMKMLLPGIIPFNILRAVLNGGISLTVYQALQKYIRVKQSVPIKKK